MSAEGKVDFIVKPSTKFVCVWTLPKTSKAIVRVEVEDAQVVTSRLFKIACDTIGLSEPSRKYFALFRGISFPTKKYGYKETIFLPIKIPISLQKWCFDVQSETRIIKTDPEAFRLLSLQVVADIENNKLVISEDEEKDLKELQDNNFFSHKQFVERARLIDGYDSVVIRDVEVVKKVKLVSAVIQKGTMVDIKCNPKRMTFFSDDMELSIPWRKIRSFAEISETGTICFEVFIAEEKTFSWIEVKAYQSTLLLQMTGEFINNIRCMVEKPDFKQPKWVNEPMKNRFSWKLFKQEVFGVKKEEKIKKVREFDSIDEIASSDESDEEISKSKISLTRSERSRSSNFGSISSMKQSSETFRSRSKYFESERADEPGDEMVSLFKDAKFENDED